MTALWSFLYRWTLGTFSGALLAFGAVFAPALFAVFPPHQAGAVVRRVIPILDAAGLVLIALAVLAAWWLEGTRSRAARARWALLAVAALLIGINTGWITPRMGTLRAEAGDRISALPREDPRRREFGRLHGASSGLMLLEWALCTAALAVAPRRRELPG